MRTTIFGVLVDGTSPVLKTPTVQNLNLDRNSDASIALTVYGSSGSVIDVSADTVTMTAARAGSSSASFQAALSSGNFEVTAAQLSGLDGAYVFDVAMIASGSNHRDVVVPKSNLYVRRNPNG